MRATNDAYVSIHDHGREDKERPPWYWRLIAVAASWMILGGYLILPGLYAKDAQLRFTQAVLSVFVVALLTAGYSFTALLCFACRDKHFQAENVFLPALASSAFGLISIAYNFLSSSAYHWGLSATTGTVLSAVATLTYTVLCIITFRAANKPPPRQHPDARANLWSEQSYYNNFVTNMYPTAMRPADHPPAVLYSEDDRVNQQMALLLHKSDSRPSPDANSTFRIDLPEDPDQHDRELHSQELVGTPVQAHSEWQRGRGHSRPDSLGEQQAWMQLQERGRSAHRAESAGGQSTHSRNLSREERRRQIEMGALHT
ncbi:hypothetical protein COCC4DRAFT_152674 [Bipolaris maydis ATCC 48331]|uniref:MARVEL domain-containing protein n=2 Tax=Cochliobolus heterostrophus TaxID=5016 RepID=M2V3H2_COCH5|nr:uncharacterized protein COCC4DRAFT_152674 [Bipolaris maydis ATCC 48331]EMD94573.1 hypothetical protein COCHEDRAFT_1167558 [Bipolaris maydis C5]KAH7556233.1 hypothetical protein BM1_06759 [Bipolaris maydis]ENH99658.1 hypothetical protein COCC4DRAFT_152674 [Bipolaris maydis ATCC 48331]KAJ5029012.1 hypothetical protein J3E73DRAFT_205696 [Bipolaris maydis]KAJ5040722.1 hypothetical protein J3E74DRAFT_258008 [Bipolaris maydis]